VKKPQKRYLPIKNQLTLKVASSHVTAGIHFIIPDIYVAPREFTQIRGLIKPAPIKSYTHKTGVNSGGKKIFLADNFPESKSSRPAPSNHRSQRIYNDRKNGAR